MITIALALCALHIVAGALLVRAADTFRWLGAA